MEKKLLQDKVAVIAIGAAIIGALTSLSIFTVATVATVFEDENKGEQ